MDRPIIVELLATVSESSELIYKNFGKPISYSKKSDGTTQTSVDIEVNNSLRAWAERFDNTGFIGEEGNGEVDKEYILFVDSLDGTNAFMCGIATCSTIATLMKMKRGGRVGKPIASVIHNPITDESWYAAEGQGAYKCGIYGSVSKLSVRKGKSEIILSAICPWRNASHNLEEITIKIKGDPRFRDRQLGALGIGGGLIAQGTLDATACGENSAVEIAAMSLIVREAGGLTIDLEGNPIQNFELGKRGNKEDFLLPYGAIVAANKTVANTLLSFIKENQS